MSEWKLELGATPEPNGVRFRIWAPGAQRVEVIVHQRETDRGCALNDVGNGYFESVVACARRGMRYRFRVDGTLFPDPASRSQPEGVHGASQVVDPAAFTWTDAAWRGVSMDDLVIYELHIGTFTPAGTFDSAIARLDYLAELGVTAIEVMPVASFPGKRNWGYDGVSLFAPAACYGGPEAMKRFVDAAHRRGLAVILDVVYNHIGPDGNYLPAITGGRFFTDRYQTSWGDAINYDGPDSHGVRHFILQNAEYWAHEYHVDGLRLDAAHAIFDTSPVHMLREIARRLHGLTRPRIVIAEDERNERQLVLPTATGGLGLDGVWADDFHHQVRRLTTGDSEGYFASFRGSMDDVAATLSKGWFFEGEETSTGTLRGTTACGLRPHTFVHCIQNHDQVGNRPFGDRLNHVVPDEVYRTVSAMLLLSPYTPLLWMGQEWAASSPFQYFTDHPDELGRAVTAGRREEFRHFSAFADPDARDRIPDPQAESTFSASQLCWRELNDDRHRGVMALYRALLALRRREPALRSQQRGTFSVASIDNRVLAVRRGIGGSESVLIVATLAEGAVSTDCDAALCPPADRRWRKILSTEDRGFGGAGCADAFDTSGRLSVSGPRALVFRAE